MLKSERVLLAVLLSGLCLFYYSKTIFDFPSYTHSWTQSGYYALSLGFIDNGFIFFLPNTPNLDPQFPAEKKLLERRGITSVDFPLHPFIISIFMFLIGNSAPFIFRIYDLLWGITGIFFLFQLTRELSKSFLKSIFIVVFAFTSPVYIYYQAGFIPSVPSFSTAVIGIYYFLRYINTQQQKKFFTGIVFLTLSALVRAPFAIFLMSAFFLNVLKWLNDRKINLKEVAGYGLSFLLFIGYFLYNKYLAGKYGTMFLGKFIPAGSWHEAKEIFNVVLDNWKYHFFTIWHYVGFVACLVFSIYYFSRKRIINKEIKTLLIYFLLSFSGALVYFILMEQQFIDHDYYFLDSFFLPSLLLLLLLLSFIPLEKKTSRIIFVLAMVFLFCGFIIKSKEVQKDRNTLHPWDREQIVTNDFFNSGKYLDSLHIPSTAKILVIETYSPYSSLILLERKGYTVITTDRENLEKAFDFDFDYMVFPNDLSVSDVILNYPEMLSLMKKTGDNGKISVYKKEANAKQKSIYDFMGINPSNIIHREFFIPDTIQQHYEILSDSIEFSQNFSKAAGNINCKGLEKIFFASDIHFLSEENNLQVVCLVKRKDKTIYYTYFPVTEKKSDWQKEVVQFRLPENLNPEDEIVVYLWNVGKRKIQYRNMEFIIYK